MKSVVYNVYQLFCNDLSLNISRRNLSCCLLFGVKIFTQKRTDRVTLSVAEFDRLMIEIKRRCKLSFLFSLGNDIIVTLVN